MKTRRLDLQAIRSKHQITQQKLSAVTGYPQSFISQIERGKVSVPLGFIEKLKTEFNIVDVDDYVTYIDITKPAIGTAPAAEQEPKAKKRRSKKAEAAVELVQTEAAPTAEQQTIARLVELLEKSEKRNEKLEAEVATLREKLLTLK